MKQPNTNHSTKWVRSEVLPAVTFPALFLRLVALLTALSLVYLVELYVLREPLLHAFLWSQGPDRFGDFWHYRTLFTLLHRPAFFMADDRFAYPAPCALVYEGLYRLGRYAHVIFDLFLWSVEAGSALLLARALHRQGLGWNAAVGVSAFLAVTSYPWHFLYDRGNIELFVYLFIAAGVWAWLEGQGTWAALCWGLAGALKLYPLILLALFFRRGQWRWFLLGLAACCVTLVLSFWYVGPSISVAAQGTVAGVLGFTGHYGAQSRSQELVFDHSILGALKEIFEFPRFAQENHVGAISRGYQVLVVVCGPAAYLLWQRRAQALNRLCVLLLALVLLPPVSYDYTLIYTYLVLGIVLCCALHAARHGAVFRGAVSYAVAFAVLCTGQNWLSIFNLRPNGLLKCLALLTVAWNVLRYPLDPPQGHWEMESYAGVSSSYSISAVQRPSGPSKIPVEPVSEF